jgi:hypothetical protein
MKALFAITIILFFAAPQFTYKNVQEKQAGSLLQLRMKLSAFGVESDDVPNIDVYIDFVKDSSFCEKSYYNPSKKGSVYTLSQKEKERILQLLSMTAIETLTKTYTVPMTDQARSTMTIYTSKGVYEVDDYGLQGERPLQELYDIVYKF